MESSPSSQSESPRPHPARLFQGREQAWRHLGYLYETGKLLETVQTLEAALPALMALVTQVLPVRTALVLEGVDASGEPLPEPPRLHVWRLPEVSEPEFTRTLAQASSRHAFLLGLPPASAPGAPEEAVTLVTLPLVARGRVSGTLQVQATGSLSEEGLAFIDAVVHQLARALERAHTLRREVLRRERAEADERRAREDQARVADAGALLARAADPRASLPELARLLVPAWADGCVIDLFPEDPQEMDGPERMVHQFVEPAGAPPSGPSFAARVLATHPWVTSSGAAPAPGAGGAGLERAAWPGFPDNLRLRLCAREHVVGVLLLVSARPGRHDALDPALLEVLAQHIAAAVDCARLSARVQRVARGHEDLLTLVSQRFKTPLHRMTFTSEQLVRLARGGTPHPRQQQLLESLLHSAEHMCALLDELEARMAARGQGTPPRPHRVEELVDKALHHLRPLALGKGQQLVVGLGAGLPRVSIDLDRMLQVLTHLLGNAITASPPGGRVTVGARTRGNEVCLWVRDTGPGIPAADLPHLFQPRPGTAPASERGHGLGLHRARALVEDQGGTLWVESPPGAGSTFFFTLPAAPEPPGAPPGGPPGGPRGGPRGGPLR